MALLSKDQILGVNDKHTIEVEVPEWGGSVLLQTMSGASRDAFEGRLVNAKDGVAIENLRAVYVSHCIVDEAGELMFTGDDVVELGKKSATALDRVFAKAQELNAVSDADIEELEKN